MRESIPTNVNKLMGYLGRHLVALCVTYREKDSSAGSLRYAAYSCTLLHVDGYNFLLTAGHNLKGIHQALRSDRVEVLKAELRDNPHSGTVHDMPIPFDLKNALMAFIDDDGLDFGVILLHPNHVRLLDANGMVAVREENWVHQHSVKFDVYFMLGFPEELTSSNVNAIGEGTIVPTLLVVQGVEDMPGDVTTTLTSPFVGKLRQDFGLESVVGMSGGPILGFDLTPPMRYWVVALQSRWLPDRRLVFGCPISTLGPLLTEAIRAAHGDVSDQKLAKVERSAHQQEGQECSAADQTPDGGQCQKP